MAEVAHAAAQHKAMPDGVVIRYAFANIENYAQRVNDATYRQQRHAAYRQLNRQLINHYQRQPAHCQIRNQ